MQWLAIRVAEISGGLLAWLQGKHGLMILTAVG
jgi:hypothetical protein